MTARQAAEWAVTADPSAGLDHHIEVTCPACGATGRLEGQDVLNYEWESEQIGYADYEVRVLLTVGSDYFGCPTCHLVLDGYEVVKAAGLDEEFPDVGDPEDYVDLGDYGND